MLQQKYFERNRTLKKRNIRINELFINFDDSRNFSDGLVIIPSSFHLYSEKKEQ